MDNLGQIFYSVVLPIMLTTGFAFLMEVLRRKSSSSTTTTEFQALLGEVQEERKELKTERDSLKENFKKLESYKRECDQKIEEYRKQALSVMDEEMAKRRVLETENASLKNLVNTLTEKLAAAQERILILEEKLRKIEEKELEKELEEELDEEEQDANEDPDGA